MGNNHDRCTGNTSNIVEGILVAVINISVLKELIDDRKSTSERDAIKSTVVGDI